jgi:hypothetical protein
MRDAVMHEASRREASTPRERAGGRSGGTWERPVAWAVAVSASLAVWGLLAAIVVILF